MVWKYEKFRGDGAVYAFCPKCNFHHNPSKYFPEERDTRVIYQYNYCPICGEYLYDADVETNGYKTIWEVRDIAELHKEEINFKR